MAAGISKQLRKEMGMAIHHHLIQLASGDYSLNKQMKRRIVYTQSHRYSTY